MLSRRLEMLVWIYVSSEKDTLGQALAKMHAKLSSVLCQVQDTAPVIALDDDELGKY